MHDVILIDASNIEAITSYDSIIEVQISPTFSTYFMHILHVVHRRYAALDAAGIRRM